jgi:hypothetical protein
MKKATVVQFVFANVLVLSSLFVASAFAQPVVTDVTLKGSVTCARCLDLSQHKGFTPWSWAMYKVSQGDDIVFVSSGKIYTLQGDRRELSKYVEDKAIVSGHLDANTIQVTGIVRPPKEK